MVVSVRSTLFTFMFTPLREILNAICTKRRNCLFPIAIPRSGSSSSHSRFCETDEPEEIRIRILVFALRNRWTRDRCRAAHGRRAGWQRRSRDEESIALGRSRTTGHANTCKGVDVGIGSCEAVCKRLEEGNDLVLLRIGQPKHTDRHVLVVLDLRHRPAVYLFGFPCWAVPGSDVKGKDIARVVEVDELLQALDVAVVEERLLEVRPGSLGGRTLWWHQSDIAGAGRLHFAV